MVKKFDINSVKQYLKDINYEFVSGEYIGLDSKILVKCDKGHIYETNFKYLRKGRRCKKCYHARIGDRTRLTYDYVKDFIEKEDGYKLLSDNYIDSKTKLKIQCKYGHIYDVVFSSFNAGKRCPKCADEDNAKKRRFSYEFVKSDIEQYGYKLLSQEYKRSGDKIKIQCNKGHIYEVAYRDFRSGHRCAECYLQDRAGKSRRLDYDFVKQQIESVEGYKLLSEEYKNSTTKLKIQCSKGHIYNATYGDFKSSRRCKICSREKVSEKQRLSFSFVKHAIEKEGYFLLSNSYKSNQCKLKLQCPKGHIYFVNYGRFRDGQRCPVCSKAGRSNVEKSLQDWLSNYITIKCNKRFYYNDNKNYYEADIYVPSKKLAIEFDGLYHHSELTGTSRDYHLKKTEFFENKNIKIIHIFENEWMNQKDIVKSIILSKLGLLRNKEYARNCSIKEIDIDIFNDFVNINHLQGNIGSNVRIGLFNKCNELVSVMSFGKCRFNKHYDWEMLRFCNKLNMNVIGGFSKLLKYFTRNYDGSLISYADRRYSNGEVYKKNGFRLSHVSEPNYFYFKSNVYLLESRVKYQKHKLHKLLDNFKPNLSEWENMKANGFNRIFDCGNLVFVKE